MNLDVPEKKKKKRGCPCKKKKRLSLKKKKKKLDTCGFSGDGDVNVRVVGGLAGHSVLSNHLESVGGLRTEAHHLHFGGIETCLQEKK